MFGNMKIQVLSAYGDLEKPLVMVKLHGGKLNGKEFEIPIEFIYELLVSHPIELSEKDLVKLHDGWTRGRPKSRGPKADAFMQAVNFNLG
jgi:hypothetical protein